ncbi:MAG: helix-hairpin-helix domain-containing protein [Acidobacteria bacterium]|nr:helix-hairpin-helix domain-containing protein [Acidobacteriota bacterium]
MDRVKRCAVRLSGLCGLFLAGFALVAGAQDFPEGKGKETVESVCAQCHGLRPVYSSKMTPEQWKRLVDDMVGRGAPLLDDEIPVVVEYLSKSFPKVKSDDRINVNKATARELETALSLSAKEAEGIVHYREENGYYLKWEDLGKAPGLESRKIETLKDRLTF